MRLTPALFFFLLMLPAVAQPPNIIYIMADDMGYADAGAYGGKEIRTPNIDRLAREGSRFTQVYAGHPVCAPSRNVLMTGLHTGHTTVRNNFSSVGGVVGLGGGKGRVPLKEDDLTVAEVLKKAGYVTGMTGKWGLGEPNTAGEPNLQGFDEWFGYLNQRRAHTYYPTYIWLNQGRFDLKGNQSGERTQYTHDLFTGSLLASYDATPPNGSSSTSPIRFRTRPLKFRTSAPTKTSHGRKKRRPSRQWRRAWTATSASSSTCSRN